MSSITYYGTDNIEAIPNTIPLNNRNELVTKRWTFSSAGSQPDLSSTPGITADNVKINNELSVTSKIIAENTTDLCLHAKGKVLINGDLYVNTEAQDTSAIYKKTINNSSIDLSSDNPVTNHGGNIYAGAITGISMAAQYRDLGERFEIDNEAPKGSIVCLGGDKEITLATNKDKPFGIIATEPALRMNNDAGLDETHPFICWCGRVPCRVIGTVKKFDKIYISDIPGVGSTNKLCNRKCIGIALQDKNNSEEGLIEVITQGRLY